MKADIRKMTKLANSTLIDHKALIKADFARKGMNLQKYCKEVIDDLSDGSDDNDSPPQPNENVSSNYTNFNDTDIVDDYGMNDKLTFRGNYISSKKNVYICHYFIFPDLTLDHEHQNQMDFPRISRNYNDWLHGDYTYIKEFDKPEE